MSEKEELSLTGDDDENPKVAAHLDILSQALPVARLADIDLNTPPVSGEDYLTRVRYTIIMSSFRHLFTTNFSTIVVLI